MGYLIESSTLELICTVVVLQFILLYIHFKNKYSYWSNKGVPHIKPVFPFGNLSARILDKKATGVCISELYFQLKKQGHKYAGFYIGSRPFFMPIDPELCKTIMVKDFAHFVNRGVHYDEHNDPLSGHLFALTGPKWRKLRSKLTFTFTSSKLRMALQNMLKVSKELTVVLEDTSKKNEPVNVTDILGRFSTDIIASWAFGVECNSLKNTNEEFRRYANKIFDRDAYDVTKHVVSYIEPGLFKALKLTLTNKDVAKFFMNVLKQSFEYREANQLKRKDLVSLLLKLKKHQSGDDGGSNEKTDEGLALNELAAHCFIFFLAGFETTLSTMKFALFEMCQNQHVQNKLREEIHTVLSKHGGEITHEAIMEMTYMDKVINETLRKFAPVPILIRRANESWKIPGTDVVLDKDTSIMISTYGMQNDPEHFPDPEVFDPERFSDENKSTRHAYCHLPFGEGPRNCIGMRYGLLQTKVGLTIFLKDYKFDLHPNTILPIQFDTTSTIMAHKYGIWLKTSKI